MKPLFEKSNLQRSPARAGVSLIAAAWCPLGKINLRFCRAQLAMRRHPPTVCDIVRRISRAGKPNYHGLWKTLRPQRVRRPIFGVTIITCTMPTLLDLRSLTVELPTADGPVFPVNNVSFTLGQGESLGLV